MIRFLLTGVAVLLSAYLLPGVHVEHYGYALLVAFVLAAVNAFVRPIFIFFTLPLTVFSLGLFLLVINALMILLVYWFVPGFEVDGFWWALLFSLLLYIFNRMIEDITGVKKKNG